MIKLDILKKINNSKEKMVIHKHQSFRSFILDDKFKARFDKLDISNNLIFVECPDGIFPKDKIKLNLDKDLLIVICLNVQECDSTLYSCTNNINVIKMPSPIMNMKKSISDKTIINDCVNIQRNILALGDTLSKYKISGIKNILFVTQKDNLKLLTVKDRQIMTLFINNLIAINRNKKVFKDFENIIICNTYDSNKVFKTMKSKNKKG